MKLMLISSTSELLEPAEVTLTESAVSPLHRYCPHLSWSKDLEWELPLVQGSALGTCRLQDGGDRYGKEGTKRTCTVQPGHLPHPPQLGHRPLFPAHGALRCCGWFHPQHLGQERGAGG